MRASTSRDEVTIPMPPTVAPQPLIPASGCLMFEQNPQSIGTFTIQEEMCFVKRDQPLPKNEAAYRLQPDAPVAQLDRVRGYEPRGREFESLRARQLIEDDAAIRAIG